MTKVNVLAQFQQTVNWEIMFIYNHIEGMDYLIRYVKILYGIPVKYEHWTKSTAPSNTLITFA